MVSPKLMYVYCVLMWYRM